MQHLSRDHVSYIMSSTTETNIILMSAITEKMFKIKKKKKDGTPMTNSTLCLAIGLHNPQNG